MSGYTASDCAHMAHALRLAARGRFTAHPNPMVGCVLVADGEVIAEGWHQRTGEAHAEVNALRTARRDVQGATAYVTLEPCSHQGKTGPCTDALIAAGVARVVVAMSDPFESSAGRGCDILENAGIEVSTGLMQASAAQLNAGYLARITRKRPFVRLKLASSLDGATAMDSGESQWITGPEARADVQKLRAQSGAILTAIGTVLADDPSLNVRAKELAGKCVQPMRVVLDSQLRMPLAARMLALSGLTLVCCATNQEDKRSKALQRAGAEVMRFATSDDHVDINAVLEELADRGVNNVLVEAGPILSGTLLQKEFVDEIVIYQAPHILGSKTRGLVTTPSLSSLSDKLSLDIKDVRRVGADTRITANVQRSN